MTSGPPSTPVPTPTPTSVSATLATSTVPPVPPVLKFAVDDIPAGKEATQPLAEVKDYMADIKYRIGQQLGNGKIRWSRVPPMVEDRRAYMHGLIRAVHYAFQYHFPLELSPDDFWVAILQGLSIYVNTRSDDMRKVLLGKDAPDEKQKIIVKDGELTPATKTSASPIDHTATATFWQLIVNEFSKRISEKTQGEIGKIFTQPFSTTSQMESTAMHVAMMDMMKNYFKYESWSMCGIPHITLRGTVDDWKDLLERIEYLRRWNDEHKLRLDFWLDPLHKCMSKVYETANNIQQKAPIDVAFWQKIYNFNGSKHSGDRDRLSGWLQVFFPFIARENKFGEVDDKQHYVINKDIGKDGNVVDFLYIPSGLSSAPFSRLDMGITHEMRFVAGFFGVKQDRTTLAVRPAMGITVIEE